MGVSKWHSKAVRTDGLESPSTSAFNTSRYLPNRETAKLNFQTLGRQQ
jgi:hypothetical protein